MISILVHGPDFACSENLTRAFALWDDVQLISLADTDWRQYDPGLIVTDETREQALEIVNRSDLVMLGDATAFKTLYAIAPRKWRQWARELPMVGFFGATAYFKGHDHYDSLCQDLNINPVFLLPNLIPLASMPVVPLHHPMPIMQSRRGETMTIMHSPGRDGKAEQKGTAAIEQVLARLENYEFNYARIMYKTLAECLQLKSQAHVFIDQLPPPGVPSGVGKSGLEALAFGSATFSAMYNPANVRDYFEPPPVLAIRDEAGLEAGLRSLLDNPTKIEKVGRRAVEWVRATVEFKPWLEYVGKFIK